MSILALGDLRLETPSAEVTEWSPHLSSEISALHATLDAFRMNKGFGRAIAAPQVGIMKRMIAMNLGADPSTLINPKITWSSGEEFEVWDDCLSIPDPIVRV
jgi:peptide deformylase